MRAAAGSRPTSERVREALFSHLGPFEHGDRVLDTFCAGGALGLEALSRGAGDCLFVDSSNRRLAVARGNAEQLGLAERCRFRRLELPAGEQVARRAGLRAPAAASAAEGSEDGPFDVVLADPPYDFPALMELGHWLACCCVAQGTLVLEHSARHAEASLLRSATAWQLQGRRTPEVWQRSYGETQLTVVRW